MFKPVWIVVFAVLLNLLSVANVSAADATDTAAAPEVSQLDTLTRELDGLRREQAQMQARNNDFFGLLQQAPDLVEQMRHEIGLLEKQSDHTKVPKTVDAMESAINLLEAQAQALQINLNDVMDKISEQQSLPTNARDRVATAQKQIKDLQDQLRVSSTGSPSNPTLNLKNQVLRQQLDNVILRRDVAQSRLEGYQKLLELYTVNRDLLLLRMGVIKSALEVLRNQRDSLRQQNEHAEQVEAAQLINTDIGSKHALTLAELETNQRLSKTLFALTDSLTRANDQLSDAKQELQDIRYRYEMAQQQLELTEFHQQVDDYLVRQRQTLQVSIKEQKDSEGYSRTISQSRLNQFKYDDQLHQVRGKLSRDHIIDELMKKPEAPEPERQEETRRDLQEILDARAELLSKLVEANAKYVVAMTNLDLVLSDQLLERERFFELLNQKLLWRRSASPLDVKWLQQLPGSVIWFVTHPGWMQVLDAWMQGLVKPVYPLLGFMLVAILLSILRPRLHRRLKSLKTSIGNVMKDKFRYSAEALLITVLLAAPVSILITILALPLINGVGTSLFVNSVGRSMVAIARWIFVLEFVRSVCHVNGLARAHFSWRSSSVVALRRWMPVLYWQVPWAFVFNTVWFEGDDQQAGLLGRAAYLTMAALFWVFTWRLMNPASGILQRDEGREMHWYQQWSKPLFWFSVLIPTVLLGLAFEGFNFTAMIVNVLLYQTIMLAFVIFVLDQVFVRWFAVQERKIALERALAKREAIKKAKENQEAAKSSGDGVPDVDLPSIDVATISEQNRAMLRVLSYTAFVAAVWWTWQDTFQAANIFGNLVLWTYSLDSGDTAQQIPVTLSTLIITIATILLTYVSVKNLPGLIEVVVLQRFSMDSGVRFAVTTTARYFAMIGGVMLVSNMIGLDWSRLGWLVAALGVGLGFGLQEIFANFISGLIILYERPIRIGDTVTINDLSGTVSRIRMRATTITDWDQKELIIPNKTFVTSQFINWTLSDSTTRLVVRVGVAYGTNTDLVTETLLKIGQANEMALKDPAPTAFFLGFGDSTLDFELRVFISQFNRRLVLLHELNTEIDKRFKQLGVEIAFPQMDVHIKHMPAATIGVEGST